ncbi:MAG: hypothetical protein LBD21_08430 [Tannerellaceae bacterium]|nr:hypothetical protein [Tannerellaceae bacterium]
MLRKFITRIFFFAVPIALLLPVGLLMPSTPHSSRAGIFGQIRKDSLLRHAPSPRIIFVGGSNVCYGLHSEMLRDSLLVNPVNTAITVELGLQYMLEHTIPFVRPGDVVIILPEYDLLYGEYYKGSGEAPARILGEVNKEWLSLRHNHLLYLPKIAFSRFDPRQYLHLPIDPIYTADAFNQYGDTYLHWGLPGKAVTPRSVREAGQAVNPAAIREIQAFGDSLTARGARMLISYPCFMETSFRHNEEAIRLVEAAYKAAGFRILGSPERYMMPDSLMFDTHYHLTKQGVDLRTRLLIEDLTSASK